MQELDQDQILNELTSQEYKFGFTTDVETEVIEKGLSEDVVRLISSKKEEPEWLLEFRLKAYRHWLTMEQPEWAHLKIPAIDFQDIIYYADPTKRKTPRASTRWIRSSLKHLSVWVSRLTNRSSSPVSPWMP